MKKTRTIVFIFSLFISTASFSQGIGINNDSSEPDPSAILDVKSSTKGMLVPRMTAAEAYAISNPAEGLLIYATDVQSFLYYKTGNWNYLTSEFSWELADFDFDTKITSGGILDDDTIRFYVKNAEVLKLDSTHIVPLASNIFIGKNTGISLLPGEGNIGIGHNTLLINNQSGIVAIGDSALCYNHDTEDSVFYEGEQNTAVGNKALMANYTGSFNTALGYEALKLNSRGSGNTAIGSRALSKNNSINFFSECLHNTAVGAEAMQNNARGSYNTGVGSGVFWQSTMGDGNCALGYFSLPYNSGSDNSGFGRHSLFNNGTGNRNVALGAYSMHENYSGNSNVAVGNLSLRTNYDGNNCVAIGDSALYYNEVSENVAVGSAALLHNIFGFWNTAVGTDALYSNISGYFNIAYGHSALSSSTTGAYNSAAGVEALHFNVSGDNNTAFGMQALYHNLSGGTNVAVGVSALSQNTDAGNSVAVGFMALSLSNSSGNVAIGSEAAMQNTFGNSLTAIGYQAAYSNEAGSNNTAVGYQSLFANTGQRNTAVGAHTGADITSGNYNTIVGAYANVTTGTFFNSAALGDEASITASSQVRIGDAGVSSIGGFVDWTNISDERFKTNVSKDVPGLEFIGLLEPLTYNLNVSAINEFLGIDYSEKAEILAESGKENIKFSGFIAQDVESAAQSIGYEFSGVDAPKNEKDYYGLRYAEFVVPLVKAVQELAQENKVLIQDRQEQKDPY